MDDVEYGADGKRVWSSSNAYRQTTVTWIPTGWVVRTELRVGSGGVSVHTVVVPDEFHACDPVTFQ